MVHNWITFITYSIVSLILCANGRYFLPDFDAVEEVGGNLGGLALPPTLASSNDYGAYLHKNPAFRNLQPKAAKPVSQEVSLFLPCPC